MSPSGKTPHDITVGCCGWSYDAWKNVFYPKETRASDYLEYYAQYFDVVEVDSTFYRIPSRTMVARWRDRTPEGFRFALKMPQVITHEKMLRNCDEEMESFISAARLLKEKLLCVCLQFGYFRKEKFATLQSFLDVLEPFLRNWPEGIAVAVEIRNRKWIGPAWVDFLRRHYAAMVLVQQSWMPSPDRLMERFDVVTGPFGYVRLLGDRKGIEEITTTWNKTVIDKTDEIRRTAAAIRAMAARAPVVAFANNHYAGFAPATAETLEQEICKPASA